MLNVPIARKWYVSTFTKRKKKKKIMDISMFHLSTREPISLMYKSKMLLASSFFHFPPLWIELPTKAFLKVGPFFSLVQTCQLPTINTFNIPRAMYFLWPGSGNGCIEVFSTLIILGLFSYFCWYSHIHITGLITLHKCLSHLSQLTSPPFHISHFFLVSTRYRPMKWERRDDS